MRQESSQARLGKGKPMPGKKGLSRRERFMQYLPHREPNTCWVWQGGIFKGEYLQYGKFKDSDGRSRNAHRVSYEIAHECILKPHENVLHTCDVPRCCNPDHLYLGSHLQNAIDRETRGRSNPRKGEDHHKTTLTAEEVQAIRESTLPQRVVAKQYEISQQSVSKIKLGIRWSHIPYTEKPN